MKVIALIAMLIDHFTEIFGWEGWNMLPFDSSYLRYIGRISFPVFAFFLVSGWSYTSNKEKYLSRILLFAAISQIPFNMALAPQNMTPINSGEAVFYFKILAVYIPVAAVDVISYWYFALKRRISLSLSAVAAAAFLPMFILKAGYIWLIVPSGLNVLYTLALGLVIMFVIDSVKEKTLNTAEYIWLLAVAGLLLLSYGVNSDYGIGFMGVILIAALYFTKSSRILQSVAVATWGAIYYGMVFQNFRNAVATLVPAIFILLYKQEHKNSKAFVKWIFYILYPMHLLLLGIANIYIKYI